MEIVVDFPGGSRVDAHFGPFTVKTDQPPVASAPTPFSVFLSSIGTCAGIYVLGFCHQRGIPAEGIRLVERLETDPATGLVAKVWLDIHLPPGFPEKYRGAVIRAAEQCKVKKQFEHPPVFEVNALATEATPA